MVVGDGSYRVELSEIILIWSIVSMPGNDIEWRVVVVYSEEFTLELVDNCPLFFVIFIP